MSIFHYFNSSKPIFSLFNSIKEKKIKNIDCFMLYDSDNQSYLYLKNEFEVIPPNTDKFVFYI